MHADTWCVNVCCSKCVSESGSPTRSLVGGFVSFGVGALVLEFAL